MDIWWHKPNNKTKVSFFSDFPFLNHVELTFLNLCFNFRFCVRVRQRDARTLCAELMDSVAQGTFICTDGWAAYGDIERLPVGWPGPR